MNDFIFGPLPMRRRLGWRQSYDSVSCRECVYLFRLMERAAR